MKTPPNASSLVLYEAPDARGDIDAWEAKMVAGHVLIGREDLPGLQVDARPGADVVLFRMRNGEAVLAVPYDVAESAAAAEARLRAAAEALLAAAPPARRQLGKVVVVGSVPLGLLLALSRFYRACGAGEYPASRACFAPEAAPCPSN